MSTIYNKTKTGRINSDKLVKEIEADAGITTTLEMVLVRKFNYGY